jgi:hypothetical protein
MYEPQKTCASDRFTDLFPHPDVLLNGEEVVCVPENLRAGSIVRCKMRVDVTSRQQKPEYFVNAVVLGIQVDPEDFSYSGLFVLPMTRSLLHSEDTAFLVHPQDEKACKITGVLTPNAVPYGDICFIPMSNRYFTYWNIAVVGKISESFLIELMKGLENYQKENGRVGIRNSSFIQGSHYTLMAPDQFELQQIAPSIIPNHPFSSLDADVASQYRYANVLRIIHAVPASALEAYIRYLERQREDTQRMEYLTGIFKQRAQKSFENSLRYSRSKVSLSKDMSVVMSDEKARILRAIDNPQLSPDGRVRCEAVLELLDQLAGKKSLQDGFRDAQKARRSIELPTFLWQGRYISMNIPDLMDESIRGNAYRPVAVWRVWEDRDSGKIMAIEGHPCTRGSRERFQYGMRANPLYTRSLNSGDLVADCIVRLPFNPRYIQDNVDALFNELPNDKYRKFCEKITHANTSGQVRVYGIRDIPANWVERVLPQRPDDAWFAKQVERGALKLDDVTLEGFKRKQDAHGDRKAGRRGTPKVSIVDPHLRQGLEPLS